MYYADIGFTDLGAASMGSVKNQPMEFNLWDGQIKPVEWYFGEEGKAAFESTFENVEEMSRAIEQSNWIFITFNVCYQSSKKPLGARKNWLIKYFYEYVISRYSTRMATNEHTLVLITKTAYVRLNNGNTPAYPYPDCLDDEINPVLYYFSRVRQLLPSGYDESTYPILKDIAHYVYNALAAYGKDVSRESWIYDKSLYVDDRGLPEKYGAVVERLQKAAEFPECLHE